MCYFKHGDTRDKHRRIGLAPKASIVFSLQSCSEGLFGFHCLRAVTAENTVPHTQFFANGSRALTALSDTSGYSRHVIHEDDNQLQAQSPVTDQTRSDILVIKIILVLVFVIFSILFYII